MENIKKSPPEVMALIFETNIRLYKKYTPKIKIVMVSISDTLSEKEGGNIPQDSWINILCANKKIVISL